jgi:hypothetical protein
MASREIITMTLQHIRFCFWLFVFLLLSIQSLLAMGLRSFVALPVEKDGTVVRLTVEHKEKQSTDFLTTNLAYGISQNQTLFLGLPYRLSPSGSNQTGNLSVLYRHIVWQDDQKFGTNRLGLLGGAVLPTKKDRDGAIQAGAVATFYRNRHEIDMDILYRHGLGDADNSARYDLSWQYRLSPEQYSDWDIGTEWDVVLELNGRYLEGQPMTHQITTGLQWIHKQWVLEGGIYKDMNNQHDTGFLLSTRYHF